MPLGPNIIHHISRPAFLLFHLALYCQEAPELFAIKSYLALAEHCQHMGQNVRKNRTNWHEEIDSETGLEALCVFLIVSSLARRSGHPGTWGAARVELSVIPGDSAMS